MLPYSENCSSMYDVALGGNLRERERERERDVDVCVVFTYPNIVTQ